MDKAIAPRKPRKSKSKAAVVQRVTLFKPGGSLALVALACRTEPSHGAMVAHERERIYAAVASSISFQRANHG